MNYRDKSYSYSEVEVLMMKYGIAAIKYMRAGSNEMPEVGPTIIEILQQIEDETTKESAGQSSAETNRKYERFPVSDEQE